MQQFGWVTEMHLGEGGEKPPDKPWRGERRNNSSGSFSLCIQIQEKITAVLLAVEKDLPLASLGMWNLSWGG